MNGTPRRDRAGQDAWCYDPGETPKKKHGWNNNEAGFVRVKGRLVGKCPRKLSLEDAERLLRSGIPEVNPRQRDAHLNLRI